MSHTDKIGHGGSHASEQAGSTEPVDALAAAIDEADNAAITLYNAATDAAAAVAENAARDYIAFVVKMSPDRDSNAMVPCVRYAASAYDAAQTAATKYLGACENQAVHSGQEMEFFLGTRPLPTSEIAHTAACRALVVLGVEATEVTPTP